VYTENRKGVYILTRYTHDRTLKRGKRSLRTERLETRFPAFLYFFIHLRFLFYFYFFEIVHMIRYKKKDSISLGFLAKMRKKREKNKDSHLKGSSLYMRLSRQERSVCDRRILCVI